jgi:hypothetical protein
VRSRRPEAVRRAEAHAARCRGCAIKNERVTSGVLWLLQRHRPAPNECICNAAASAGATGQAATWRRWPSVHLFAHAGGSRRAQHFRCGGPGELRGRRGCRAHGVVSGGSGRGLCRGRTVAALVSRREQRGPARVHAFDLSTLIKLTIHIELEARSTLVAGFSRFAGIDTQIT